MIKVLIADDQPLVRTGLTTLINHAPDLEYVGEAVNGAEAVELASRLRPDVIIMDVRMPLASGIEATRRILSTTDTADVRVLVLTTFDADEHVYEALRSGASGFLLKDVSPETLLEGIRLVAAGEALLHPAITRRLISEFARRPPASDLRAAESLKRLTEREQEILYLVAQGLSNAEIADREMVSYATVKTHVSRILTKLGMRDRAQLVVLAYETGVVTPGTR